MTTRWAPPLPSFGRGAPRILVEQSSTVLQNLEEYYFSKKSIHDIFECRVSPSFQKDVLGVRREPRYLSDMSSGEQTQVLLRNLYFKASSQFKRRLASLLFKGKLGQVRQWFHTANAAILPYLLSVEGDIDYKVIDSLVRWALENCANNYAQFQRLWKSLKKSIRKSFALRGDITNLHCVATMVPYLNACRLKGTFSGPTEFGRYILLWSQTRATGAANHKMIELSINRFVDTVTTKQDVVTLNPKVLVETLRGALKTTGRDARISVGPTACLESTRKEGGKTAFLSLLSTRTVQGTYDLRTLEFTPRVKRICCAADVVDWAIFVALHYPTYVRCVRLHAVSEPGKARTITVAAYAFQVIMGVFAHLFQPTFQSKAVRSGLKADRHLWRFLRETLNPQNVAWEDLIENQVLALSTDLSEATDFGNLGVARQIWQTLIELSECEKFPLAFAVLAKTLYCGKRFIFIPGPYNTYSLITRTRGWFMGDMMTKVMLTAAHDYCCRLSRLATWSLVGDDEIALDNSYERLEQHLRNLALIFKVSDDDTFISRHFAFYCEEGVIIPQRARDTVHVQMRRGQELSYLDYPRIRLFLPVPSETQAYSMTNIGRFALLGKETKWVSQTNPSALEPFRRGSVLQHLMVPMDSDTHCPFTPIEMGGDGAFPHSAFFLEKVIASKSKDANETNWRIRSLMRNKFTHKFVRSERLDKVIHKHHILLPKVEGMEALLPPSSVIKPTSDAAMIMLRSLRFDQIETPDKVFLRLARGLYYQSLFAGKEPIEPKFSLDRHFSEGKTIAKVHLTYLAEFIDRWRSPGFISQDTYNYFVDVREIPMMDPLSLNWDFDRIEYPGARDIFNLWARKNVNFLENSLPEVLNTIRTAQPLPNWVVDRLNLFMESDSYILHTLPEITGQSLAIATRDVKLCKRVVDVLNNREWASPNTIVLAVDPLIYLTGRFNDFIGMKVTGHGYTIADQDIMQDPGSILHVDYNEFEDGFPLDPEIWDKVPRLVHTRYAQVVKLVLEN